MILTMSMFPMKFIGEVLIAEGLVSEETLSKFLDRQSALSSEGTYKPIGQILLEEGVINHEDLKRALNRLILHCLKRIEMFQGLSEGSLHSIAEIIEYKVLPPDTTFINQGEAGDSFCIIISGQVRIYRLLNDRTKVSINTLAAGECLGEMSLLTGKPRSASVETIEPTGLLLLSKENFNCLLENHPSLNAHFLKVLSEWLNKSNIDYATTSASEQAYQQFVTDQTDVPYKELIGKSKKIKRLRARIKEAASQSEPVVIIGEPGTEKLTVATLLHRDSGREGNPFLSMNAKTVSLKESSHSKGHHDPLHLEIAQKSALFGHEKGDFSFARTRRLGFLEVGSKGSTVIEEFSALTPSTQEDLADFLETGEFRVLNAQRTVQSSALVIAMGNCKLDTLRHENQLNPRLLSVLERNCIVVPPLRERKRDLSLLVDHLIERFNQQTGKHIQGIEREAYARIMTYDWPGNMEELEVVIRRAVNLAQGDQLKSEDVFIGPAPAAGKLSFNLLRLPKVSRLLHHRAYPAALQIVSGLFFAFILYEGFWGAQSVGKNLSLPLTWGVWEPMIIISAFFAARIWCAACPIGALTELISRRFSFQRRVPHFIRLYGFWLGAVGLGVIIWSEVAFQIPHSPLSTAILISCIALLAVCFGVLFQRRTWCRYVCPLGYLVGTFAQCSAVEMRSNYGICNNECQDHSCFVDKKDEPGCPIFQAPFSLASNLECILCAKCLKSCQHQSPALNLRIPGYELSHIRSPSPAMDILVPVILGSQLFRALNSQGHFWVLHEMQFGWLLMAIVMIGLSLGAFCFVRISGAWSFGTGQSPMAPKGRLFNYVLLPLVFAFELAYQLEALLTESRSLIPALGRRVGLSWDHLEPVFSQDWILFWQSAVILAGLMAATIVLKKLALLHQGESWQAQWQRRLPLWILAGSYLWGFFTGA